MVVQSAVCTDGDCTNEADAASLLQGRLALESKYPDEIEDVEAVDDEEDPLHPISGQAGEGGRAVDAGAGGAHV